MNPVWGCGAHPHGGFGGGEASKGGGGLRPGRASGLKAPAPPGFWRLWAEEEGSGASWRAKANGVCAERRGSSIAEHRLSGRPWTDAHTGDGPRRRPRELKPQGLLPSQRAGGADTWVRRRGRPPGDLAAGGPRGTPEKGSGGNEPDGSERAQRCVHGISRVGEGALPGRPARQRGSPGRAQRARLCGPGERTACR